MESTVFTQIRMHLNILLHQVQSLASICIFA